MVPVEENIDVIEWVADPAEFIYNTHCSPKVDQVIFDKKMIASVLVVVPDNKHLAIGRRGQAFLAAHLTGYRIDIKSAEWIWSYGEAGQVDFADTDELLKNKSCRGGEDENKKNPFTKSVVSNEVIDKRDLLRIVRTKKEVFIDPTGKANGRGAYIKLDVQKPTGAEAAHEKRTKTRCA